MVYFLASLSSSRPARIGLTLVISALVIVGFLALNPWDSPLDSTAPPLIRTQAEQAPTMPPTRQGVPATSAQPLLDGLGAEVAPTIATDSVIAPVAYELSQPVTGGDVVDLAADIERVGWVNNDAHSSATVSFPDFNIYAGTLRLFDGALRDVAYSGAIGFDLSQLDFYGPAVAADLLLFGLNADNQQLDQGTWTVEILADDGAFWDAPSYESLAEAPVAQLVKAVDVTELGEGRMVRIPLESQTVELLNGLRYRKKSFTLRVNGPTATDSLFGFDGGLGIESLGNPPRLLVSTGPPAPTVTPIVVTATPMPENVETAAAIVVEETRLAETGAKATPTPYNVVTATPTEEGAQGYWVDPQGTPIPIVVPTEQPENAETAVAMVQEATAAALTTGTPTPLPGRFVTATPTPLPVYFVATVTPENIMTLAAELVAATYIAQTQGTPTPFPTNAVIITPTPRFVVVTATPRPANIATAQIIAAQATVDTVLIGTPTPAPYNLATATPIPLLIPEGYFTPTPTATPAQPLPPQLPSALSNKILFRSDRTGVEGGQLYAVDPVDGITYSVTQPWVFLLAQDQLGLSPDGKFEALVLGDNNHILQIQVHSKEYGDIRQLTSFTDADNYDPAWSPTGEWIAFVGTDSGNDEIYIIRESGSEQLRLTHNTWEWDKHPSWSPDGSQIVFWSNRESGRRQLWIMNADGSNQRNLSSNGYNDWDPIWVR